MIFYTELFDILLILQYNALGNVILGIWLMITLSFNNTYGWFISTLG